jgi:hypothetical protein
MNHQVILSLCDFTGNWPHFYREAGYDVRLVDVQHGQDVRLMTFPGRVHGILAAPPCTVFANSGARWPRTPEEMAAGLAVVDACLRFVTVCRPIWWALENPVGKLSRYLGDPVMRFDPCDFGDPYTKRTCLWGCFARPIARPVEATEGSKMHLMPGVLPGDSVATATRKRAARSATPLGFAKAFFEANP